MTVVGANCAEWGPLAFWASADVSSSSQIVGSRAPVTGRYVGSQASERAFHSPPVVGSATARQGTFRGRALERFGAWAAAGATLLALATSTACWNSKVALCDSVCPHLYIPAGFAFDVVASNVDAYGRVTCNVTPVTGACSHDGCVGCAALQNSNLMTDASRII